MLQPGYLLLPTLGRINSSHQSNHGASQIDNRGSPIGQRIGSENTVADAIHVALSASMGSELEDTDQVDRKGGRPNSGARWIKVGYGFCVSQLYFYSLFLDAAGSGNGFFSLKILSLLCNSRFLGLVLRSVQS